MRYFLLVAGLIASFVGLVLLLENRPMGSLWLQVGAGFLAVGLATCDIVAAIRDGSSLRRSQRQLEQFRQAAQSQDTERIVQLLAAGGIPEDLARLTATSVVDAPDRFRI